MASDSIAPTPPPVPVAPLQTDVDVADPSAFLAANTGVAATLGPADSGHYGIGKPEIAVGQLAKETRDRQRDFFDALHPRLVADRRGR